MCDLKINLFNGFMSVEAGVFTVGGKGDVNAVVWSILTHKTRRRLVLCVSVCFGDDAQEKRGGLIWTEGGWNNQVLGWFQHQELHHFAGVHVGFGLGHGRVALKEGGWKLSIVGLVL